MSDIETNEKPTNPLLKKLHDRMPGETFRLPSMGILYTNGELDESVKNGEILIRPMTTMDDIYMKSPDMIFQGTALDSVIKRCVIGINKPLELFMQDIDYILICLKKVSSGNHATVKHKCSKCGRSHEYDIPLQYFIQNSRAFDPETLKKLKVTLSNGFTVEMQPTRIKTLLEILQVNESSITDIKELNDVVLNNVYGNIKKVDDITDREFIKEWLYDLPKYLIEEFIDKIEVANNWGTDFDYEVVCDHCENRDKITSSINPLFFFIQQ